MYNNLYNNKRDKFKSASTARVEHERLSSGKDMEILFALQSTDYKSVVLASDMNHCFCKTRIKAEIKKKTTLRQLAQIIISSSR